MHANYGKIFSPTHYRKTDFDKLHTDHGKILSPTHETSVNRQTFSWRPNIRKQTNVSWHLVGHRSRKEAAPRKRTTKQHPKATEIDQRDCNVHDQMMKMVIVNMI